MLDQSRRESYALLLYYQAFSLFRIDQCTNISSSKSKVDLFILSGYKNKGYFVKYSQNFTTVHLSTRCINRPKERESRKNRMFY